VFDGGVHVTQGPWSGGPPVEEDDVDVEAADVEPSSVPQPEAARA
jgi:hypothetical protein